MVGVGTLVGSPQRGHTIAFVPHHLGLKARRMICHACTHAHAHTHGTHIHAHPRAHMHVHTCTRTHTSPIAHRIHAMQTCQPCQLVLHNHTHAHTITCTHVPCTHAHATLCHTHTCAHNVVICCQLCVRLCIIMCGLDASHTICMQCRVSVASLRVSSMCHYCFAHFTMMPSHRRRTIAEIGPIAALLQQDDVPAPLPAFGNALAVLDLVYL